MTKLTKRERQIMEIFWHETEPLSISEVHQLAPTISKNTIAGVLKKLFNEKLLEVATVGYSGTVLARKYSPTIKEEEFISQELSQESLANLVSNFIDRSADLNSLNELEELIEKRKHQLTKGRD